MGGGLLLSALILILTASSIRGADAGIPITVDSNIQHGTVELSATSGTEGQTITVTPKPNAGYRLKDGSLKYSIDNGTTWNDISNNLITISEFNEEEYVIWDGKNLNGEVSYQITYGDASGSYGHYPAAIKIINPNFAYQFVEDEYRNTLAINFVLSKTVNISKIKVKGSIYSNSGSFTYGTNFWTGTDFNPNGGGGIVGPSSVASLGTTSNIKMDDTYLHNRNGVNSIVIKVGIKNSLNPYIKYQFDYLSVFEKISISKFQVTAEYEPIEVNYKVNHYIENVGGSYSLIESETKSALTDSSVNSNTYVKQIEGFTLNKATN